jgi:cytochrome c oxidase subunit 4
MTPHAHHSQQKTISMTTYVLVFIALMVLLVATVWVALLRWDLWHMGPLSVVIALAIATIKALLVVLFFMHVKLANRLTQTFVLAAFIWLGIMFVFTFTDYLTRGWMPNSSGWVAESTVPAPPAKQPEWVPAEHAAQRPQGNPNGVQPAGGRPTQSQDK